MGKKILTLGLMCIAAGSGAEGVLRVHPENPRYFTDDTGKAIYLAGHQWFNDLQYNAWNESTDMDWDEYLNYIQVRGMNYLRNWIIWSVGFPEAGNPPPIMPFRRTGPGLALDGKPKFDLTEFNPEFFERLHTQMKRAEEAGVYVSIMLFEVYGFMGGKAEYPATFWAGNMFHGPNNINGIDVDANGDGQGMEFFFTDDARILEIQKNYVAKILDTVNDCGNVFFEIANELEARDWQYDMIDFVHEHEKKLPNQHLVYLSPGGRDRLTKWSRLPIEDIRDSPAEVYAVTRWKPAYRGNPPVQAPTKPVFMDMDHIAATDNDGDNDWNNNPLTPWKLFTRGYHLCIYDHDYWNPGENREQWDKTRWAIGRSVALSRSLELAKMQPHPELSSTGFCIADPGIEYVILCEESGKVSIHGLHIDHDYSTSWSPIDAWDTGFMTQFTSEAPVHIVDCPDGVAPALLQVKLKKP